MKCNICGRALDNPDDPASKDCGGDCVVCMAEAGDPECVVAMDVVYLFELAERLRHIPVMYGTDDGDISRLGEIAKRLEKRNA